MGDFSRIIGLETSSEVLSYSIENLSTDNFLNDTEQIVFSI